MGGKWDHETELSALQPAEVWPGLGLEPRGEHLSRVPHPILGVPVMPRTRLSASQLPPSLVALEPGLFAVFSSEHHTLAPSAKKDHCS